MATLRTVILAALLASAPVWAQRKLSVAQLEQFIKSSLQQKFSDKQIADFLKDVQLTDRLTPREVEILQGQNLGARTLEQLRALSAASEALKAAAPVAPAAPAPPPMPAPSKAEQDMVLAQVTQVALDYSKNLPNFTCIQRTRRYADEVGHRYGMQLQDEIQEQLSLVDGRENYVVMVVNNRPVTNVKHTELGGATSSGEFGSQLREIFRPESKTSFVWSRWATLRSRRMHVFAFRVEQKYSEYSVHDVPSGRTIVAGYHGEVFADADSKAVMRIQMTVDGLEDFPVRHVDEMLDYDPTTLKDDPSGTKYVLPMRAELNSSTDRYLSQNLLEFRLYRKFSAEAKIITDIPEEIPKDQLEEQPAK